MWQPVSFSFGSQQSKKCRCPSESLRSQRWLTRTLGNKKKWKMLILSSALLGCHFTVDLLLPQKSPGGGNAMTVRMAGSDEGDRKWEAGGSPPSPTKVPTALRTACWSRLLWGQHGFQVRRLTYLPGRLCLSRSFLGVSCRSQLKDSSEEVESLRPSKRKGLRNSGPLWVWGQAAHREDSSSVRNKNARAFDSFIVDILRLTFFFIKRDKINKNRHSLREREQGRKSKFLFTL